MSNRMELAVIFLITALGFALISLVTLDIIDYMAS